MDARGTDVVVRRASAADAAALADLKIAWDEVDPTPAERADFAEAMGAWMRQQGDRLIAVVAFDGAAPVGMANVLVYPRVPTFDDRDRTTGDVQSVYVRPEWRGRGIGGRMLAQLIAETDRLGIPRVTVSSSSGAVNAYDRAGFAADPLLRQRHRPGE